MVAQCEELGAVFWKWQAVDGALGKARFGGGKGGAESDRSRQTGDETERVGGRARGPLAAVIAGANVHDTKLLDATLTAVVVERPAVADQEQHLCLDKGYDNPTGHAAVAKHHYVSHIRRIGEDATARRHKKSKPRRWVVERTLSWLSKCRALLVRYDKNWFNPLGLMQLAGALLWYRRAHRLGAG